MHQRVFDVEVVWVMEDGDGIAQLCLSTSDIRGCILVVCGFWGRDAVLCCGGHGG